MLIASFSPRKRSTGPSENGKAHRSCQAPICIDGRACTFCSQACVVLHQPCKVMLRTTPPSAVTLEAIDDARCPMPCGAGQLDALICWPMALDVDFDVLEPPVRKERQRRASERVARRLARAGG